MISAPTRSRDGRAGPDITSDTGILMDADTGVVLYNKGGDEQRYPASITKIMTLLVAVENSTMDEKVTFTETGVRNVTVDSSNIGTKVGEVLTMEDCLHALIIQSANDVAAQIAEHIGGTEQAFIDMMKPARPVRSDVPIHILQIPVDFRMIIIILQHGIWR